jgi:peptide chain release factor 2
VPTGTRVVHRPTGVFAESRSEVGSRRNFERALRLLRAKLHRIGLQQQQNPPSDELRFDERGDVLWSYKVRSYFLHPHPLVKDPRSGIQTRRVAEVLDGELGHLASRPGDRC